MSEPETPPNPLATALAFEAELAVEAAELRGDATELNHALMMKLWPLLKRPIPPGFIQSVGAVTGKPYESTGVKSVQVLIDRMDAVLTPLGWWEQKTFEDGGKLAHVTVFVGSDRENPLFSRDSHGGVDRGSTVGNVYKGSYTNAAKLAFARVGPGHEIYLGAADLDPDTNETVAKAQEGDVQTRPEMLSADRAENLAAIIEAAGLTDHLPNKLRSFGKKALTDLSLEQGMALYEWSRKGEQGG